MIDKISVLLSAKTLEFLFFIISKASTTFSFPSSSNSLLEVISHVTLNYFPVL